MTVRFLSFSEGRLGSLEEQRYKSCRLRVKRSFPAFVPTQISSYHLFSSQTRCRLSERYAWLITTVRKVFQSRKWTFFYNSLKDLGPLTHP